MRMLAYISDRAGLLPDTVMEAVMTGGNKEKNQAGKVSGGNFYRAWAQPPAEP